MGKREGRRGEWEETIWAYWVGSLMWAVFQPPLGHLRIGLGPGTLPYQGVFTACAGRTTLCESSLFCFTLSVYSFALLKWHIAPGQPHCSNCSLQKGDGLLCSVVQEGCTQANSPVSAAGRDLLTVYWCPLLQLTLLCLSSLCEESTVPCSTWLCCVFFGGSNTKIQWAEVFGFLLLMMSNRCHLLNRPYDGRVFQEVFNITDMRMCACMFKKEMGSRTTEGVEKLDKCWFEVSVKLQMVQGNVGWKAGSPYLSLAKTTQSIQNRWLPISLKLSPWGHLGHPRLFGNCVAPLSKKD